MEQNNSWIKLTVLGVLSALFLSNCVQTYDAAGRPVQTVDPGAAIVGAAVIGAVAYAAGNNNNYRNYRHRRPVRRHY